MNPLTQIKNTQKISAQEILAGVKDSASWHARFKHSAYIYAGGLPYDLTEGDLLAVFSQYGEIVDVNLVRDKETGKSKGFCFIAYEDQRSTVLAVDNLSGAHVVGRIIRVEHVLDYKMKRKEIEKEGGVVAGGPDMPIREAGPDAPGRWINSAFEPGRPAPLHLELPEGSTLELPGERGGGGGGSSGGPAAGPSRGNRDDDDALLAQLRARKLAAIQSAARIGVGGGAAPEQQHVRQPSDLAQQEGQRRRRADDDREQGLERAAKKAKKDAKKAKKAAKKAKKDAKRAVCGESSPSSAESDSDSGRKLPKSKDAPRGKPVSPAGRGSVGWDRNRDRDRGVARSDYRHDGRDGQPARPQGNGRDEGKHGGDRDNTRYVGDRRDGRREVGRERY